MSRRRPQPTVPPARVAEDAKPTKELCFLLQYQPGGDIRSENTQCGGLVTHRIGQAIISTIAESLFLDAEARPVEADIYPLVSTYGLRQLQYSQVATLWVTHTGNAPPLPRTLFTFNSERAVQLEDPWVLANDMADRIGDVLDSTRYAERLADPRHDQYSSGYRPTTHIELVGGIARVSREIDMPTDTAQLAESVARLGNIASFMTTGYTGPHAVPHLGFAVQPYLSSR